MAEHADDWARRVGRTCGARYRTSSRCSPKAARRCHARRPPDGRAGDDVHGVPGTPPDDPEHVQDRRRADTGGHPRGGPHARHTCPLDLRRPQRRDARPRHGLGDAGAGSVQEAHDFALVSHAATLRARVRSFTSSTASARPTRSTRSSCSRTTTSGRCCAMTTSSRSETAASRPTPGCSGHRAEPRRVLSRPVKRRTPTTSPCPGSSRTS